MTNWQLITNIIMVFWILLILVLLYIIFKHNKNEADKGDEINMGFTNEEDKQSEYLALKDNLELLKTEIRNRDNEQALKRIDYIIREQI